MFPALSRSPLAIHGARAVRSEPFPRWPQMTEDEIAAAIDVMRSGQLNYCTGEQGREFEREFANTTQCRYAVAVSSGTAALELALRSLNISAGDDVVTSSRTFVASASCIAMCGARPVFAEVDRDTQNVTGDTIRAALTPNTKAVIVVHLGGWPCEMESILELVRERNLFVIEDCAQAQGATWKGRPVGSFGDAAAFSFCQDKIMTTLGEGGMLTTNSAELWQRAHAFRDHGRKISAVAQNQIDELSENTFRWVHDSIGTNWRMTEAQSAVGRVQLRRVPLWLRTRRTYAQNLSGRLGRIPSLRVPIPASNVDPAWYRFYAFLRLNRLREGWNRDRILDAINAEGVPCFAGSCGEVYLEKAFSNDRPAERHPMARELGETSLAFLMHPTLQDSDIEDTCRAVEKVLGAASI